MTDVVGLITARGGSKAIPKKNIVRVGGKPLIAWSIEAALASNRLARLIVSTDDGEIAGVARAWGAEVPFMRPPELATDDAPHIAVVEHAATWLTSTRSGRPDYLMVLQPTSPLRTAHDIDRAVELAEEKDADSVISVCATHSHPYWTKRVTDDGRLEHFVPVPEGYQRRQVLPPAYFENGAIFLVRGHEPAFYAERTYAYIMPEERSLQVDTEWDLRIMDALLRDQHETCDD